LYEIGFGSEVNTNMKSPFPGMDPYLETRWADVHSSLTIYSRDLLNRMLPPGLLARSEERAIVSEADDYLRDLAPDVSVFERGQGNPSTPTGTDVALAESVCLVLETQEIKQRFLEIRDARSGGRVITVIEFVSPTNKRPGDGLGKYRQKRRECQEGKVNLVEIDLTRSGDRSLIMPVTRLQPRERATYMAMVSRATDTTHAWFYRLPLRKRLDGVPIPLRPDDQDVVLDLQTIVDQIYENGRYDDDLTYTETLNPPLSPEEAQWAAELVDAHKSG